jgi:hypothetical protein
VTPVLSLGDPVSVFAAHADRMHSGSSGKTLRMLIGNFLPSCIRVDAPVRKAVYHHLRSLCVSMSRTRCLRSCTRPFARRVARYAGASRCAASAIYRVKPRARRLQSVRQARYRDRLRGNFVDKKVTHHTVTQAASSPTSSPAPEITTGSACGDRRASTGR